MLEIEWWRLRACCYDVARIKIYVVKVYVLQQHGERNHIAKFYRERKKNDNVQLTAVRLLLLLTIEAKEKSDPSHKSLDTTRNLTHK